MGSGIWGGGGEWRGDIGGRLYSLKIVPLNPFLNNYNVTTYLL